MRFLLEVFLFCCFFSAIESKIQISSTLKNEIVDQHNKLRTKVAKGKVNGQPKAANMKLMYWDEEIAKKAQKWADNCDFQHEGDSYCGLSGFHNLGENLGASTVEKTKKLVTGSDLSSFAKKAIKAMFNEQKHWEYGIEETICYSEPCGHYTQIVWADSEAIGCGMAYCKRIKNWFAAIGRSTLFLVCKYGPGGNVLGVYPYNKGKPCTGCSKGATCINGALCDSRKSSKDACEDSANSCKNIKKKMEGMYGTFACWDCEEYKNDGSCDQCYQGGNFFQFIYGICRKTCGFCDINYKITNKY